MKLTAAGHSGRLHQFCSSWSILMLALYQDVVSESGQIVNYRDGAYMDLPYREILALRFLRSRWAEHRERELERMKKKRK